MAATMTLSEARAELAALQNPKVRAMNEKRGDDHGMNLSQLRQLAKRVKVDHELARQLWATGETSERLLALLICRPKQFELEELDGMLRETQATKVGERFMSYVVKKSPHSEELRLRWFDDPASKVAAAGWSLTAQRVAVDPAGLDLAHLLELIERDMQGAPDDLQWSMNEVLAQIGIHHPQLRERALAIGNRLQVLADYPTSPGCTSPFAPIWIAEMVRRQEA